MHIHNVPLSPPGSRSAILIGLGLLLLTRGLTAAEPAPKPLKILLVTGGCCHDYTTQKQLIKNGLEARAHVEVTCVQQGGDTTDAKIPLYENADWAAGYDLVIHDECFAAVTDVEWAERILAPHKKGLPGVVLHCAMHCYRNGTDNWFRFCGVTSRKHGAAYPHEVLNRDADHPIMKTFGASWANPAGELYWIEKVWPTAHPLAVSKNRENGDDEVCVWINDYQGTRVFGTTLGHHNETIQSPQYLDLLTRGSLWACGQLNDTYLKPPAVAASGAAASEAEQKLLGEFTRPRGLRRDLVRPAPQRHLSGLCRRRARWRRLCLGRQEWFGRARKEPRRRLPPARRRWRRPRRRNPALRRPMSIRRAGWFGIAIGST